MPLAGDIIEVGRVPGWRIGIQIAIADVTFTATEVVLISVTVPLVQGRIYSIFADISFNSTVDGDECLLRIREDNSSGTIMQERKVIISDATGFSGYGVVGMFPSFQAISTGNKTFVVDGLRTLGSGTCRMEASGTRPSHLEVTYKSG